MEFLTNPWVIGIGTAIIAGLVLRFVFGIGKPKPRRGQLSTTTQEQNHSTHPPVPVESATNDITPQSIFNYLDSLPPLQKASAAEHYKGIKVSWRVNLRSGRNLKNGKLRLMMGTKGRLRPWIYCEVDPEQYPLLRVIKETQSFMVDGEIKQISVGDIELKNCRLSF